jgi:hypothetical protein
VSDCLACGHNRADICQLFGHVNPTAYTATGAQLRVAPFAEGIPFDQWQARQPVCDPADLRRWIAARERPPETPARKPRRGESASMLLAS